MQTTELGKRQPRKKTQRARPPNKPHNNSRSSRRSSRVVSRSASATTTTALRFRLIRKGRIHRGKRLVILAFTAISRRSAHVMSHGWENP
jgi:hypothetical protein